MPIINDEHFTKKVDAQITKVIRKRIYIMYIWSKDRITRIAWYLLLRIFRLLLLKFNFWKEDWPLGYASTKIWDFSIISLFLRSYILSRSAARQETRIPICYTKYHLSIYLWLIGFALKYCKVPGQNTWNKIEKSSKFWQDNKSLISIFPSFLTAIDKG